MSASGPVSKSKSRPAAASSQIFDYQSHRLHGLTGQPIGVPLESNVAVVPTSKKRKVNCAQGDSRIVMRRLDLQGGPPEPNIYLIAVSPLPYIFSLPTELVTMVAELLNDRDLYNLTCVNHRMADLTCTMFLARQGFTSSSWSLSLNGDTFGALPMWRRSPSFTPVCMFFCNFDYTSVKTPAQIRCLQTFLLSLPPTPMFEDVYLWNCVSIIPDNLLDLLELVGQSGCRTLEVDAGLRCRQRTSSIPRSRFRNNITLHTLQDFRLTYNGLSNSEWTYLLSHLVAPALRKLQIKGDLPFRAVINFLRHHPRIQQVHLRGTSRVVNYHLSRSPLLCLLGLRTLEGSLPYVLALLQSLSSPPSLTHLAIDAVADLPHKTFMEMNFRCLALCKGQVHFAVGFIPSSRMSRPRRLQLILPQIDVRITSFHVRAQKASDEDILDFCHHFLQLLPGLLQIDVSSSSSSSFSGTKSGTVSCSQPRTIELLWDDNDKVQTNSGFENV